MLPAQVVNSWIWGKAYMCYIIPFSFWVLQVAKPDWISFAICSLLDTFCFSLGDGVFRVWTHREFDKRVFRRTVHVQTGPEKTWIGRLLSHRYPASWTLQAVRGRQTSDFFISLRSSQMVLFKMRHVSKHDCTNTGYVTIIITTFYIFLTYQKPIHVWFVVSHIYLPKQNKSFSSLK